MTVCNKLHYVLELRASEIWSQERKRRLDDWLYKSNHSKFSSSIKLAKTFRESISDMQVLRCSLTYSPLGVLPYAAPFAMCSWTRGGTRGGGTHHRWKWHRQNPAEHLITITRQKSMCTTDCFRVPYGGVYSMWVRWLKGSTKGPFSHFAMCTIRKSHQSCMYTVVARNTSQCMYGHQKHIDTWFKNYNSSTSRKGSCGSCLTCVHFRKPEHATNDRLHLQY